MASNSTDQHNREDDEYQVQEEDEEDDEQTIEEEEQLASDDEENELDDLEAGASMPLEDLLKLYGQNSANVHAISRDHDGASGADDEEDDNEGEAERRRRHQHLLQVNGQLLPEDDDDDSDDSFEPEIIKSINVGDEYQVIVRSRPEYNLVIGPFDEREVPDDELLWAPAAATDVENETIDEYLKTIRTEFPHADDELALRILLTSQMNTELALVKFRQLPVKTLYSYRAWSFEEVQQFEEGLREYGKNFFKITVFKCPSRTVREVIHYYYQWKKTERCQIFLEEQQRMNEITSVTDMIQRLIEQQEQQLCTAVSVLSSTSSAVLSNDLKINSTVSFVQTTKRSYDQVETDFEPSASKKPALNNNNNNPPPPTTIV